MGGVKTIYIPEDVKIDETGVREIRVKNLSESDIFDPGLLSIYYDFLYLQIFTNSEIIKLDLKGNIVKKLKNYGEGPGEFVSLGKLREYNGDIAFTEKIKGKLLIYTKDFQFLREMKMKSIYVDFFLNTKDEIVFTQKLGVYLDYYFFVYDKDTLRPLRRFGKSITKCNEEKLVFDDVRSFLYMRERDGILASFKNRYDLRYYENEKLLFEIKAPKGYFKSTEVDIGGKKIHMYYDRSACMARCNDCIFHLYTKDKFTFCDIFAMSTYTLLKRIKLKINYWYGIAHWKGNVFYGVTRDPNSEDEDIVMNRIEFDISKLNINK